MRAAFIKGVAVLWSMLLSGCTVVDRFSDRAVAYNIQAESARSQGTLLNIVRAAYRKPLQFTELTTVTGQASASGGLGAVLPLGGPASGFQINPTSSLTGGPTFNVAALNNREFYLGILSPIPMQIVAYYLQVGYPRKLLLTLLLGKIVITANGRTTTVMNTATSDDFERFQNVLDDLINAGLTVEQNESTRELGPPLAASQVAQVDGIAKLNAQGLELLEIHDLHGRLKYRVLQKRPEFVFCFDAHFRRGRTRLSEAIMNSNRCGNPHTGISPSFPDGFAISTRSTMGLIYFLGEISRRELGLSREGSFVPVVRIAGEEDTLFSLRKGRGDASLSVTYQGIDYKIVADPDARDHSSQILDFVQQLLAVNSSAKDLPAPNVITVIGR